MKLNFTKLAVAILSSFTMTALPQVSSAESSMEQVFLCSYTAPGVIISRYGTLVAGDQLSIQFEFETVGINNIIPTQNGILDPSLGTLADGKLVVSHSTEGSLTTDITRITVTNTPLTDFVSYSLGNGYTGQLGGVDPGGQTSNIPGLSFSDSESTILSDTNYPTEVAVLNLFSGDPSRRRLDLTRLNSNGSITSRQWVEVGTISGGCQVEELACNGLSPTILGTDSHDHIIGTEGEDVIMSLDGNDTIEALDGDDVICSGKGNDTVLAGAGADWVSGGRGNDTLAGNNGPDFIRAGSGNDTVGGGKGDDVIEGNKGTDVCNGGKGTDSEKACEVSTGMEAIL